MKINKRIMCKDNHKHRNVNKILLEIVTVLGIFSGVYFSSKWIYKLIFIFLSIFIVIVWKEWGAPKSKKALTGLNKLIFEIIIYGIGIISFYIIFGTYIGSYYSIISIVNLVCMYSMKLQ